MENTMNRRSFLKGVAAAGTGLAFAAGATGALAEEADEASADAAAGAEPSTDGLDRWLSPAAKAWRTPKEPVADDQIADGGTYAATMAAFPTAPYTRVEAEGCTFEIAELKE